MLSLILRKLGMPCYEHKHSIFEQPNAVPIDLSIRSLYQRLVPPISSISKSTNWSNNYMFARTNNMGSQDECNRNP